MRALYLVRHANVEIDPDVPAPRWRLSDKGQSDAARLAGASSWRQLALVASSPEPKALETARPIAVAAGLHVRVDADLREVERSPALMSRKEWRETVDTYLRSGLPGWEAPDAAAERLALRVDALAAEADGSIGVVSHGTVLTLFLAARAGRPPSLADWSAIPLPGVCVFDLAANVPLTPFLSVLEFLEWERRGLV